MRTKSNRILKHQYRRPIRSRSQGPSVLFVQKLSITHAGTQSYLKIHPSQTKIPVEDLLSMVLEKRNYLVTASGEHVQRQDLLSAASHLLEEGGSQHIASTGATYSDPLPWNADEPRRPSNAFILYSNATRKRLQEIFPEYPNSEISKVLGALWSSAPDNVKRKYTEKAEELRKLHREIYPTYSYHRQQQKRRDSSPCHSHPATDGQQSSSDQSYEQIDAILYQYPIPTAEGLLQPPFEGPHAVYQTLPSANMQFQESGSANSWETWPEYIQQADEWQDLCNKITSLFPYPEDLHQLLQEPTWPVPSSSNNLNSGIWNT